MILIDEKTPACLAAKQAIIKNIQEVSPSLTDLAWDNWRDFLQGVKNYNLLTDEILTETFPYLFSSEEQ